MIARAWCHALAMLALAGCGGTVMHFGDTAQGDTGAGGAGNGMDAGNASGMGGGGPPTTTTTGPGGATCQQPNAGSSVPLTLTNLQYDNTVRDLFGYTGSASKDFDFPPDPAWGFLRGADSPERALQMFAAAAGVAAAAVQHLDTLLPCDLSALDETACADAFIEGTGLRAYRRPLTSDDKTTLHQAYVDARATGSFKAGIQAIIEKLLRSSDCSTLEAPHPAGTFGPRSPYEIATRLSYFLLQSTPDPVLLKAAEKGELGTVSGIANQVRALLARPDARAGAREFFSRWLQLDSLTGWIEKPAIPEFAGISGYMRDETAMFTESVFFGGGPWSDLLISRSTFLNGVLAPIYGQPGIVGTTLVPTTVDASQRSGLLTQASFLSIQSHNVSSPTLRGKFVRMQLLCQALPPPPQGVPELNPNGLNDPTLTTRQRYEEHRTNPVCSACHQLMDSIGMGFENYDAIGRFRTVENSKPIDAHGEIVAVEPDLAGPFNGAIELGSKLASSHDVQSCMARQLFRFALSRDEALEDQCSIDAAAAVASQKGSLVDIVVALVTSDSFRYARW